MLTLVVSICSILATTCFCEDFVEHMERDKVPRELYNFMKFSSNYSLLSSYAYMGAQKFNRVRGIPFVNSTQQIDEYNFYMGRTEPYVFIEVCAFRENNLEYQYNIFVTKFDVFLLASRNNRDLTAIMNILEDYAYSVKLLENGWISPNLASNRLRMFMYFDYAKRSSENTQTARVFLKLVYIFSDSPSIVYDPVAYPAEDCFNSFSCPSQDHFTRLFNIVWLFYTMYFL